MGAPAARARTQPTSRQVGGRVRAVDDRESIDLARRPPCCHDEVHCLHYTDNQDYDDWFKGKVCKVNPPTSRTPYVTIKHRSILWNFVAKLKWMCFCMYL